MAGLPRFAGGAVGYFGYDTVRFIERLPDNNPDPLGMADALLLRTEQLLVFDNLSGKLKLIQPVEPGADPEAAYTRACEQIMRMANCVEDISRLKNAAGTSRSSAAWAVIFSVRLVLPIPGRPATIIRSESCHPAVISSRSMNPLGMPVIFSFV